MARTSSARRAAALAVMIAMIAATAPAEARKRKKHRRRPNPRVEHPVAAANTPAARYAELTPEVCLAELTARGVPFTSEPNDAIAAAVRLTGPVRGVEFRSGAPAAERAVSPYELADCRLALALDDYAAILARHDVVAVIHYSMFRPPRDRDRRTSKHQWALAIDVGRLVRRDGSVLSVLDDFHGRIGARPTCGPGARPRRDTANARAIRAILCEAIDARLFHIALTPNYNRPHRNHFHLELNPGARWFLTH